MRCKALKNTAPALLYGRAGNDAVMLTYDKQPPVMMEAC